MRVLVTGEKGFIASNLPKSFLKYDIEFINLNKSKFVDNNLVITEKLKK